MLSIARWLVAASLPIFIFLTPVAAQDQNTTVRVATRVLPPFITEQKGQLGGFSIDLWNAIAERLKLKTEYLPPSPDVRALLQTLQDQKADVAISAVSITAERNRAFDFSQPMMNAGLQILVHGKAGDATESNPLRELMRLLFSPVILVWLGIAMLLILIPAHLVWLLERRHPGGIIPDDKYFPGIFHALYWAAGTLATQADQMPRQWLARVLAILWMFTGVVFVAFYTAQLTATLTVQQIQGSINGPEDLPGRKIATTRGSTSVDYLRELKVDVQEYSQIGEAYQALADKKAEAVVFDAPVLLYYASHDGKGIVQTVGQVFRKEDYGIVFRSGSPLRRDVDGALLAMREDGTYQQLYDKWFGGK